MDTNGWLRTRPNFVVNIVVNCVGDPIESENDDGIEYEEEEARMDTNEPDEA